MLLTRVRDKLSKKKTSYRHKVSGTHLGRLIILHTSLLPKYELTVRFRNLEIEVHFRLYGEEAVGTDGSQHIHQKIVYAPVTCMNKLSHILQHIVERFNDAPLTQHDLVIYGDETLLHI